MFHDPELIFSTREAQSIPQMVEAGETVVICGVWQQATIQRYTSVIGPTGRVVFIEANPDTIKGLKVITEGQDHVTWINKAVWSEPATLQFIRSLGERHSWDRVVNDKAPGNFPFEQVDSYDIIATEADTIDNILSDLGIEQIDHLNLTVNRCEFEALEGARQTIANSPKMRLRLPSREREIERMKETLESMGFTVHMADHPKEWAGRPGGNRYRVYATKGGDDEKNPPSSI